MVKKFLILLSSLVIGMTASIYKVEASEFEGQTFYVENEKSDDEILKELEKLENEKIKILNNKTRTNIGYTVKLEFYRNEYKSTGYKVAGNQPIAGTNFGNSGGAFGYIDGNGTSPVSMSFGVSGYGISANIGVGNKASAGVNGFTINAPANQYVKLYVNKKVKAITYKRYKVYHINGYKEPYGYTTSEPQTYSLTFDVR